MQKTTHCFGYIKKKLWLEKLMYFFLVWKRALFAGAIILQQKTIRMIYL